MLTMSMSLSGREDRSDMFPHSDVRPARLDVIGCHNAVTGCGAGDGEVDDAVVDAAVVVGRTVVRVVVVVVVSAGGVKPVSCWRDELHAVASTPTARHRASSDR
jgi:hypothetical protein